MLWQYLIQVAAILPALAALPCITFDNQWNLYAFGVEGQSDWNLGQPSSWASSSGANVTTLDQTNAPPFDGSNTRCFLAQFFNAIYVLDGDSANQNVVHIFNVASQAWSVQSTTADPAFNISNATAILDHDTNVFFALSGGSLFQLDMSNLTTATSGELPWQDVDAASFTTSGYNPVMAIADNHIFFLDVPGNAAGEADIFVIHFAYFQPAPQAFTASDNNSAGFPASGGQTASIWQPSSTINAQTEFAFFPDDGSATYLVDVIHNTTSIIPYPPASPSSGYSTYAGSTDTLVQLTPSGEMYYANFNTTATATWAKVPNSLWTTPSSSQIASTTANSGQNGPTPAATTSSASSTATGSKSVAVASGPVWHVFGLALVGVVAGAIVF